MSYVKQILNYMDNNQGYITNKITKDLGIPTIYLTRMTKSNEIKKVYQEAYTYYQRFLKTNYLFIT